VTGPDDDDHLMYSSLHAAPPPQASGFLCVGDRWASPPGEIHVCYTFVVHNGFRVSSWFKRVDVLNGQLRIDDIAIE
jgi:hypothetical protein